MNRRLLPVALGLVLLAPATGPAAGAAPATMTISSAIAPGVVTGLAGFGTSSVVVPAGEKITFLAQTEPAFPGRRVEIWTKSRTADWRLTTSRLEESDGSVHYVAAVDAWTAIQARVPADPSTNAVASHGRIATASSNGLMALGVTCDEFAAANGGAAVAVEGQAQGFAFPGDLTGKLNGHAGKPGALKLGIRPEGVLVERQAKDGYLPVEAHIIEPLGAYDIVDLKVGSQMLRARTRAGFVPKPGETVHVRIDPAQAHFFDADSGRSLGVRL